MNTAKTGLLMLVLTALLLALGAIWGLSGVIVALVFSLIMNFFAFWFSDRIALAMAGAKSLPEEADPDLHRIVESQATLAGIPKPKVYVIESDSPNAFATGRSPNHGAVAVTRGIRRLLNKEELSGVIAHELAHVGNRDTLIMTMAAAIAGAIAYIAWMAQWSLLFGGLGGRHDRNSQGNYLGLIAMLVVIIVLPIAATLVRLAISRAREYHADATGAKTSGKSLALANALEKLDQAVHSRPMKVNQGVSHLFIVNPLSAGAVAGLFATHPPIAERVRRLRDM